MNTTWHSEKPPRCYGAICAALVVSTSMGQVARRVCKGSAWACLRASTAKTAKRRDVELSLHRPRFPSLV